MFHFFSHHKLIEGDYNLEQIQIEQQLGRGNSHVFTAIIRGQLFALKQIQIKDDYQYRNFLQQVTFMKDLSSQSQCMVKYYGYFITKMQVDQYLKHKYAFIIMQCAQMNLEHLVGQYRQNAKRFTIQILQNFIQTVLNALCQLQAKHIAHCDIKPQNILIMNSNNYQIKLCDVGSCKVVTGENMQQATILGTVPFLAPQLIKIKSKKIISSNPFKSDVFSFGLVFLYLITFKKFKSQQRLEVQEITYKQIINQWIKQARQIVNFDAPICQILIQALQFDQFKRPLFKELRNSFLSEKKKKTITNTKQFQDIQKQEEEKLYGGKGQQSSSYYQSQPANFINLFKSRKIQKASIKTTNGNSFRITTNNMFKNSSKSSSRNFSPTSSLASPFLKKKKSLASTSPDKYQHIPLFQVKKLLYINQKTKQSIGQFINNSQQKTFVLQVPQIPFNTADTISILNECSLQVFYMFQNVYSNRLYLEYQNVQGIGLPNDAPILKFPKIRMNLIKSSLVGGYSGLFRTVCNPNLEILQLRITESEVQLSQIMQLLDNLFQKCPKINTFLLCWEGNLLTQDQHFQLTQKIAKLPLKRLYLIMNQNYIKYDKQMAWLLPKNCQTLYLEYGHNLLNFIINNLSLSLSVLNNLKQLYLNFENNNILKGQVNMIVKSIADLKQLEKIILDISFNKIDDLNYIQKNLSQHINLQVVQIRLHKTQTSLQRTIQFIKNIKELFQFKLKILKVSINRVINIKLLKQSIQKFCVEKSVRRIICDVIGFDNSYFMIYLKKKPKTFNRGTKGSTSVRKQKLQSAIKFNNTISLAGTLNNFNQINTKNIMDNTMMKPATGLCTRLYTTSDSYQNYMCVGCCQNKQTAKNTFYCKFCIQHCFHKGHNIVKVYSRTKCSCSHSGHCMSDVSQNICSQTLKIQYKRKFDCLKCLNSYCISCIQVCKQLHKSFVKENKQITFFTCAVKHKETTESSIER